MTVASVFSSAATLVLSGSKHDHVTGADLTTVGTVNVGSDVDGSYIEAPTQPGSRLLASTLNRLTKSSGGTFVARFKTTGSGIMSLCGEIDTGTAYIENLALNTGSDTGTVTAGVVSLYIRSSSSGAYRFGRTGALSLNDGNVHTVAVAWNKSTTDFEICVDGVAQTVTYYLGSGGDPDVTSGAMNYPLSVFERNARGAFDQSFTGKIYFYARLADSGYDLESLSLNPGQIIESGGGSNATATGGTGTSTGSGSGGTATGGAGSTGTITIPAIKDLTTGALRFSQTGITVIVNDPTTGALVVKKTAQTTDASGNCAVTDALLVAATTYRVTTILADGSEGTWKYAAA